VRGNQSGMLDDADGSVARGRIHVGNFLTALILAAIGCAIDLLTKAWAFGSLGMPRADNEYWIIDGFFGFETSINTGALFGFGQGGVFVLAIISALAAVALLIWLTVGGASRDRWLSLTLGLILGGILGNLYDRLGIWGERGVRDFILFRYKSHTWPNFNVADMLLICGAALMMWHAFRAEQQAKAESVALEKEEPIQG